MFIKSLINLKNSPKKYIFLSENKIILEINWNRIKY